MREVAGVPVIAIGRIVHRPLREVWRHEERDFTVWLRENVDVLAGVIEGIVLKDRRSTYRDGSRAGWSKVKDPSWYHREAWRFDRR